MLRRRTIRAAALAIGLIVATSSMTQARQVANVGRATNPDAAAPAGGVRVAPLADHVNRGPVAHGSPKRASDRTTSAPSPRMRTPFVGSTGTGSRAAPSTRGPALAPSKSTTNANPDIQHPGFQGMTRSGGPDNIGEPPDPFVAAGPDHIMQIVNTSFRTTDRQGNQVDISSLSGFVDSFDFSELGSPQWFDPRVIYDSLHGRWLMTFAGFDCAPDGVNSDFGNGYLFFATSDTIDPTGSWTGSYFQFYDFFVDYPAPGTSTDKMAFASNIFSMAAAGSCPGAGDDTDYVGADILVLDWADWIDGNSTFAVQEVSTNNTRFTPRVALQTPATSSRLFVVMELGAAGAPHVEYLSIVGSAKAGTIHVDVDIDMTTSASMDAFLDPPSPVQPGPDVVTDAIDARPTDAIWQNNKLTFVSTYPCTPAGDVAEHDCVRVSTLNTNTPTAPTLAQDMLVADLGKDSYLGGVGYAGNGTLHVVWTRSSATDGDYPSSYHAYQLRTDAANTRSASFALSGAVGSGVYTGTRWGDYVGVAQDPIVPSAVWQANEYSGGATEWKTYVSRLQPAGATYFPITPVRVLDTRSNKGLSGQFVAGTPRTWQVTGGTSGIPSNAVAVTGNVTVTQQTAAGYVSVTPTPVNPPPSSTINFPTKDNRANNVTVALSPTGSLSAVYRAGGGQKTHLIFDVTGYFLANTSGATFKTLTPLRVLDTRNNTGLTGKFVNGTARQLQVTGVGGVAGVPAGATAITGNLTVTQQSAGGFLSVSPGLPPTNPTTSNLNFPVSDNRANGLFAPLDGGGRLWIVFKSGVGGATTHVLLDITGYFVPNLTGLKFVPLNPGRVMDTRSGTVLSQLHNPFVAGTPRVLPVDGHWGVPLGTTAISGNLTVTGQTGGGFVSMSPTAPPPVPATSTINFPFGDNRANGLVAPLNGSGDTYLVYIGATGKKTDLILDLSGYFE